MIRIGVVGGDMTVVSAVVSLEATGNGPDASLTRAREGKHPLPLKFDTHPTQNTPTTLTTPTTHGEAFYSGLAVSTVLQNEQAEKRLCARIKEYKQ